MATRRLFPLLLRLFLALAIFSTYVFIYGNSLKTSEESTAISDPVSGTIQDIVDPDHTIPEDTFSFYVRKTAHFTEFFLLGALWLLFLASLPRRLGAASRTFPSGLGVASPALASALVFVSAALDELLQSFSDRTAAFTDVLLDTAGGLTGIILASLLVCLIRFLCRKRKISP